MASALHRMRTDAHADRSFNDTDRSFNDEPLPLPLRRGEKIDWPVWRKRPSFGQRARLALTRFVITFCIGVGATLAWQSYGDAARQMIADRSPVLGWVAPQANSLAQDASDQVPSTDPAAPSPDSRQLQAMSVDLSAVRQSMDQLAAEHQQLVGGLATMQAAQQVILRKIAPPAPAPRQAPSAARTAVQN